jgi:dTDP-4-dehydrorhamnose reductase
MKILLTGGSGLLGQYLKLECDRPSHREMDITKKLKPKKYDMIIHAAAYTNVQGAEKDQLECFNVNVKGTLNLLSTYPDVPFVYISTEYAYKPVNFYSLTKNFAEELVKRHPNFLIIRTLFKATPWPFEKAFTDQITNGDYVDVIAPIIEEEIRVWNGKGKRFVYAGTGRKTIYELAKRTKPDVIPNSIKDMKVPIPSDYM